MANAAFNCTLVAWASGNTIYAYMNYARRDGLSFSYHDSSFPTPTMNIAGQVFADEGFASVVRSNISVGNVSSTTFSRGGLGNGTYTVTWSAGSGQRSDFAGTWSTQVTVNAGSAPSNLSISNVQRTYNSITADTKVANWGSTTANAYRTLKVLKIPYVAGADAVGKQSHSTSTGDVAITVNNETADDIIGTSFPIAGAGGLYYLGLYAQNSVGATRHAPSDTYYLPPAPIQTLGLISQEEQTPSASSAVFRIIGGATDNILNVSGARVDVEYRYKIADGYYTAWTDAGTNVAPDTPIDISISDLPYETEITVQARQKTHGDTTQVTENKTLVFNTIQAPVRLYGSVNNKAKLIQEIYCSVNNKTKRVEKIYASVDGKAKRIF